MTAYATILLLCGAALFAAAGRLLFFRSWREFAAAAGALALRRKPAPRRGGLRLCAAAILAVVWCLALHLFAGASQDALLASADLPEHAAEVRSIDYQHPPEGFRP